MTRSAPGILAIAPLTLLIANAEPANADSAQAPHQHGHGVLQVAIEKHTLDILFHAPAASLTGFEHAPRNDDQKAHVRRTREWLEQTPLASFSGHNCEVREVSILSAQPEDSHDTHSDDDGHHHGHEETHSEYEVSQSIRCDGQNDSLHSPLPKRFQNLETLQVEWVSAAGQGSGSLGQNRSELKLGLE